MINKFGGFPRFSQCVDLCDQCQTPRGELDAYMDTLKPEQTGRPVNSESIKKASGCNGCGKVKNIIKGFGRLVWERVTKGKPDEITTQRAEICAACEHRTFLSVAQWAIGAVQSGDLPINHEPGDWDALWCSICKCCIEAKIRVLDEQCPLGKWPK